ncbi:hypothetical protein PPROV_000441500 [Pycnococcus provasolii]|uniref:Morc S5 domain-containing protein n=1 Tax=Pycnococcus provasolii TaxID=41880 RepID=A0A830HFB3_9CHLO|nr:hypothetical protein PPROV_000441500 [Pycnococcus provasolii]
MEPRRLLTFAQTEHIWDYIAATAAVKHEHHQHDASSRGKKDVDDYYADAATGSAQVVRLAHTSPKYLHTNASSHKWVLGAIAELTDNAIDEAKKPQGASFVSVSLDNDLLSITDDGLGMTPQTCHSAVSFGYSSKPGGGSIGRYGNGLKSATMRIGRDAIVITVTQDQGRVLCTAAMISMTYHVDNNLTELRVPLKTWERTNYDGNRGAYKRLFQVPHIELEAILKYSPYACEEDLLKQFERIAKEKKGVARTVGTGTKVIVHNLYRDESGDATTRSELLATEEETSDIIIASEVERHKQLHKWEEMLSSLRPSPATHAKAVGAGACPHLAALKSGKNKVDLLLERAQAHKYSLRAYLAILYRQLPTTFQMKVQHKVLSAVDVIEQFGKMPAQYDYKPRATTTAAAGGNGSTSTQQLTLAFNAAMPFSNLHGICMYIRGRLIVPFCEVYHSNWSRGRGVIGVIDVENIVDPDHCKQGLHASEERTRLMNTLQRRVLEFFKARGSRVGFKAEALVGKRKAPPAKRRKKATVWKEEGDFVVEKSEEETTTDDDDDDDDENVSISSEDDDEDENYEDWNARLKTTRRSQGMLQEKHKQHQTVVAALAQAQAQAQAAAGAGAAAPGGAAVFVSPRSAHLSSQMQDDDLMTLALMPTMNNKLVSSKNVSTALVVKSLEQKVQGLQAQLDEKDATIQEKEETISVLLKELTATRNKHTAPPTQQQEVAEAAAASTAHTQQQALVDLTADDMLL